MAKKTRARQRNKGASQEPAQQLENPTEVPEKPVVAATAQRRGGSARPAARPAKRDSDSMLDDIVPLCVGIVCAVLPAIVHVGWRDLYQLPKTFAMTWGAAFGLLGIGILAAAGRPLRLPDTRMTWPLLGMIASIAVGVAIAPDETGGTLSLFAKMDAYRWGCGLILTGLTLSTVRRPRHVQYILGGMLAGGLFVALVGIGQHHNIDALLPQDHRRWVGINRPGSSFGNRNMAAQLIVSVFSAAFVYLGMGARWWKRFRETPALSVAIPAAAALFVLLYYLRISVTRSAWGGAALGLVIGGGMYVFASLRSTREKSENTTSKRSAMPIVAGVLVVGLLGGVVASTQLNKAKFDAGVGDEKRKMGIVELASTAFDFKHSHWDMRFMMWGSTVAAIKANPLGGGAGNWRVLYPQHVTRRVQNDHFSIAKQPVRAHQDFLQFASEYGLQGLLSLLGMIGVAFWMAMRTALMARSAKGDDDDGVQWMALAGLAGVVGIIAICVDACFSFPFQLPAPTFQFCIWVGLIVAAFVYVTEKTSTPQIDEETGETMPLFASARVAPDGVKLLLIAIGIASVVFVHTENKRLSVAEQGFTDGRAKQKRRDPSAGLAAINTALEINPDDFQNHFIQALCYNSMGRTKEAIASIEASLALYPNLLNAWVNLAMFSSRINDYAKMNAALKTALALKPDEPYALNVRAEWLRKRGEHAKIVAELEPHLDNPFLNGSWYGKANTRYLGNLLKAYEATNAWAKIPKVYGFLTKYYPLTDFTSEHARRRYARDWKTRHDQQTTRYRQDMLKYHVKSGDAWTAAKQDCKAIDSYKYAAERADLNDHDIKRKYAVALLRCGRWDAAGHEVQVALSSNRGNKSTLMQELYTLKKQAQGADQTAIERIIEAVAKW